MATEKEKALIGEITNLALDMGAGGYSVCVDYHGYIHGIDVRIAKKNESDWSYYGETIYLSGRNEIWTEDNSVAKLKDTLQVIKQYHPAFDADGVKL